MFGKLIRLVEAYDARHYKPIPCSGDILCQREGVRHKADCPSRTVPIGAYVRGIR